MATVGFSSPLLVHSQTPKFMRKRRRTPMMATPATTTWRHQQRRCRASLSLADNCRVSPVFSFRGRLCSVPVRASAAETTTFVEEADTSSGRSLFSETYPLMRVQKVEGKISVRLDAKGDGGKCQLTVGCNLPGKWVLHWGVTYCNNVIREWDQPPPEMRPPGSIAIKDYAIETPLKKSSDEEGVLFHEVQIDFSANSSIAAINFVLKEEEMGAWYQHRGRDFRVPFAGHFKKDGRSVGSSKGFSIWPGAFDQISGLLLKFEGSSSKSVENAGEGFYEEFSFLKEEHAQNFVTVSVRDSHEADRTLVHFDTDLPGDVIVHWGVCKDGLKTWEIPPAPHPPGTNMVRNKALQTLLKPKQDGQGSWGLFTLDKQAVGLFFVLKLNEFTWMNNRGSDFYIPLTSESSMLDQTSRSESDLTSETLTQPQDQRVVSGSSKEESEMVASVSYTDGIINDIRNLVCGISIISAKVKYKEAKEKILQEIKKLAAEAYSIFRSSSPTYLEEEPVSEVKTVKPTVKEPVSEVKTVKPIVKISSGTGSGYEILCQGFNWESHKTGRWYCELNNKATELSSLGFTIVWLPPPTDSVSPEGYMPRDLYNLNSSYGNMEELKILVKRFHKVGIKVLGDVVLNHRCAHYQNHNGVWNIFGGRLNWDDRAVVADDPHFQGRGNKSSGDNFHAAPNIDHSQDFVRNDIEEWLHWLREEIGYDGWRLDFARGFSGGYVKDYLDASEPYFAVGEYWDSLSYIYGEMDYNQNAHRQRIIDWINATNGTAGAFDVTTKGILHSVLERCEYWRLSDEKGKPPGVVGWWPSRAVTFIENHDTGSTQGHWRFPTGKEMQGYAYILTHPGTPSVFYDHIFSHYQPEISALIAVRNRTRIHCRSTVKILKAERDVYAAGIDEKVTMKIGPGYFEPSGPKRWVLAVEGRDYKVWEASN